MATAATVDLPRTPYRYTTLADVLAHFGGIPAYRIWVTPPPGEATEQDALFLADKFKRLCELIDGTLVEKDMGVHESRLAIILATVLLTWVEEKDLGIVLGADALLRLFPQQIRIPDVSFISWKRMPRQECPAEAVWSLAPDLAVEILSAGNTETEMERKLKDYFEAGTKLVWYVNPQARTVRVYTSVKKSRLLTEADTLDGGKVLPGFTLTIKQWLQRASRKPRK